MVPATENRVDIRKVLLFLRMPLRGTRSGIAVDCSARIDSRHKSQCGANCSQENHPVCSLGGLASIVGVLEVVVRRYQVQGKHGIVASHIRGNGLQRLELLSSGMIVAVACGLVIIGATCVETEFIGLPEPRALGQRCARVGGIQAEDRVFRDFLQGGSNSRFRLSEGKSDRVTHP